MNSLYFADGTDETGIVDQLKQLGVQLLHCNNGTYALEKKRVVSTTLAAFQFIHDQAADRKDIIFIAVNSDISMQDIMEQKNASPAERNAVESQRIRAGKVALPLAAQFPERNIVVAFYDKATPADLYQSLSDAGLQLRSLFKWGYGTAPDAPKIEGAHLFDEVFGFPLPNDEKPVCYDITNIENQPDIKVVDLRIVQGPHGAAYISADSRILFPLSYAFENDGDNSANSFVL